MANYPTVMLVDDNEIDNLIHTKMMESIDFADEVLVYETGAAALAFLADNGADSDKLPRIIFLDITMPDLDGFAFLEAFEQLPDAVLEKCRIIMLSASLSPGDIDRAASSKYVRKYLNKPLQDRYLQAISL